MELLQITILSEGIKVPRCQVIRWIYPPLSHQNPLPTYLIRVGVYIKGLPPLLAIGNQALLVLYSHSYTEFIPLHTIAPNQLTMKFQSWFIWAELFASPLVLDIILHLSCISCELLSVL